MHDVISAFVDNEPFDGQELSAALATPEGRELLLDLVALRGVVQPVQAPPAAAQTRMGGRQWAAAAAAAVLMLAGGYFVGRQTAPEPVASQAAVAVTAPEPTAVFIFEPGKNWEETNPSGGN